MRKTIAGIALALSTIVPTVMAAPTAQASEKWPTHARVITNERDFERHRDRVFRITVRAQDGHGRFVRGRASLYVNGRLDNTTNLHWGWATFKLGRHTLPNRTSNVKVVIKPAESRTRQVKTVRRWVSDRPAPRSSAGERVVQVAKGQVGDRYVWGAAGPSAFDCSGLTAYAWRHGAGKRLPHSSAAQKSVGHRVSKPRPGDLVYTPGHVALYAGGGKVIEAATPSSGVVMRRMWQDSPVFIRP